MRDEIPGAAFQDQPERIDRPLHEPPAFPVPQPHAAASPHGRRECREVRNLVLRAKPASRVEVEEARGSARALLELVWKCREDLEPCGGELAAEPELRRRAGNAGGE